jgi:lycopene cyclase domain-containing protein
VSRLTYLAVLAVIVLGSGWLEVVLHTRVYRRWRRLLLTVLPVAVVFALWDGAAVAAGQWTFAADKILGVVPLAGLPLEEMLFFVVVPVAAVLTLEAVRSVKRWEVGDEAEGECVGGVRR